MLLFYHPPSLTQNLPVESHTFILEVIDLEKYLKNRQFLLSSFIIWGFISFVWKTNYAVKKKKHTLHDMYRK